MKKTKALVLKDIKENVVALLDQDKVSPQLMQVLEDKLPEFIKEYSRDGTAIIRWNYEYLIILEYLLRQHFNFSEDEIGKLEKELKNILPKITKMKMETPLLITKQDYVGVADKMVEINKFIGRREDAIRKGIALPSKKDIKKLGGKK